MYVACRRTQTRNVREMCSCWEMIDDGVCLFASVSDCGLQFTRGSCVRVFIVGVVAVALSTCKAQYAIVCAPTEQPVLKSERCVVPELLSSETKVIVGWRW